MTDNIVYYAGIGSSDRGEGTSPPDDIRRIAYELGGIYALKGFILRSGGATGMDSEFETLVAPSQKEIFVARDSKRTAGVTFVEDETMWQLAEERVRPYAPHFDRMSPYVQDMFRRNMFQIFGADMNTPVTFVVYWAPEHNGVVEGGTRLAVYAARDAGIPTENLYLPTVRERALKLIAKSKEKP